MEAQQPNPRLAAQLAKHFREVHFGVNWTWSNLKAHLADVTWQQATTPVHSLNTIAALTYHIHYFVGVALRVLEGGPLEGSDKLSFDHPPIQSAEDWERLLEKTWSDAETFARLVEQLPDHQLWETFGHEKYGTYYRNIQGIIEHSHYHLGQLVLVKKLLTRQADPSD
jgi:hypothetical protein